MYNVLTLRDMYDTVESHVRHPRDLYTIIFHCFLVRASLGMLCFMFDMIKEITNLKSWRFFPNGMRSCYNECYKQSSIHLCDFFWQISPCKLTTCVCWIVILVACSSVVSELSTLVIWMCMFTQMCSATACNRWKSKSTSAIIRLTALSLVWFGDLQVMRESLSGKSLI